MVKFICMPISHLCRRRPAWCDRILYKTPQTEFKNMELVTEQKSYRSHPQFKISDHKPVTSEFTINVSGNCVAMNEPSVFDDLFSFQLIRCMRIHRIKWSNLRRYMYGILVRKIRSSIFCRRDSMRRAVIGSESIKYKEFICIFLPSIIIIPLFIIKLFHSI